jgi:hypothetical protein
MKMLFATATEPVVAAEENRSALEHLRPLHVRGMAPSLAVPAILFLFLAIALQYAAGAYRAGFGAYPDEPAHYVTGLMVRDYILHAVGRPPMRFAENYYLHYPAVAFGHWPPGFYIIQAAWTAVFPTSRPSLLVLIALINAITALVLYRALAPRLGTLCAGAAGAGFLCMPLVRTYSNMVMAEAPLALFTLLAVLAYARFLSMGRWRDSACFGIWASLAILTKGNAWALAGVPVLTLPLTGKYRSVASIRFWLPAGIVAVACVPYTLLTMSMVANSWDRSSAGLTFTKMAVPLLAQRFVSSIGVPLTVLSTIGAGFALARRKQLDNLNVCLCALIVATFGLHVLVPISVEARYLFMAVPAVVSLAAAGGSQLLDLLAPANRVRGLLAGAAVLLACCTGDYQQARPADHLLRDAAVSIAADGSLADSVVLVSSSSEREVAFVAEMAEHDRRRFDHIVLRAGKQLATMDWRGENYALLYQNTRDLRTALMSVPVDVIVLDTTAWKQIPHHELLLDMIHDNQNEWEQIRTIDTDAKAGVPKEQITIYRTRARQPKRARKIKIDLRDKINRVIAGEF